MNRKLVSVITGTYNRPRELANAIQQVQEQTYPNIEHVIVHDGPALEEVRDIIGKACANTKVYVKWQETGRQWSHFLHNSISAVPYQVAQWMSHGDYLMWMADDEEITPDHIELLVDLLEREDVDFVFSKTQIWFAEPYNRVFGSNIIGKPTPINGQITQALYRVELLDYRGFMTHVGSGTDWDQVESWINAGASYAFLDRVTHTHRVDKLGDGGPETNKEHQILRGVANNEARMCST